MGYGTATAALHLTQCMVVLLAHSSYILILLQLCSGRPVFYDLNCGFESNASLLLLFLGISPCHVANPFGVFSMSCG